jgi:hypothetical protein
MLFAGSESVKHCGAIAVLHLLQRLFHEANDRNTKNGSPVKNGGLWPIWDDHLESSGYLRRVTIFLRSLYQISTASNPRDGNSLSILYFLVFPEDYPNKYLVKLSASELNGGFGEAISI